MAARRFGLFLTILVLLVSGTVVLYLTQSRGSAPFGPDDLIVVQKSGQPAFVVQTIGIVSPLDEFAVVELVSGKLRVVKRPFYFKDLTSIFSERFVNMDFGTYRGPACAIWVDEAGKCDLYFTRNPGDPRDFEYILIDQSKGRVLKTFAWAPAPVGPAQIHVNALDRDTGTGPLSDAILDVQDMAETEAGSQILAKVNHDGEWVEIWDRLSSPTSGQITIRRPDSNEEICCAEYEGWIAEGGVLDERWAWVRVVKDVDPHMRSSTLFLIDAREGVSYKSDLFHGVRVIFKI